MKTVKIAVAVFALALALGATEMAQASSSSPDVKWGKDGDGNVVCRYQGAVLAEEDCKKIDGQTSGRPTGTSASARARSKDSVRVALCPPDVWGGIVGGVIGAFLGNQVGSGDGKNVATIIGAGAGAIIGSQNNDCAGPRPRPVSSYPDPYQRDPYPYRNYGGGYGDGQYLTAAECWNSAFQYFAAGLPNTEEGNREAQRLASIKCP